MALVFYKDSISMEVKSFEESDTMYGSVCNDLAISDFACKEFGVYFVSNPYLFRYKSKGGRVVGIAAISKPDLPSEIKLQLLLLGGSNASLLG